MSNVQYKLNLTTSYAAAVRYDGEQTRTHGEMNDGTPFFLRPIRPDDAVLERRFIEKLSPASRRYRFLETMRSPSQELLKLMTVIDPTTDAAYVAALGEGEQEQEIGVARFSAPPGGKDCEFAVTVADEWQNKGLGSLMMERLISVARARGIETMYSSDAADNTRMRQFAEHLHFHHEQDPEDARLVRYSVDLKATGTSATA